MNGIVQGVLEAGGVEAVRTALRTDVISILQSQIESLGKMTRDGAYNLAMNDPHTLDGCFKVFRSRSDLFKDVVKDRHGQLATQDHTMLSCGRTLADAIALIVRAAAKRYFRTNEASIPGGGDTTADALYGSMRDHLRYEWQTLLIPHYLRLPIPIIKKVGIRLFEFREETEINGLAEESEADISRRPPLLMDNASRILVKGREVIDPETLWKVCQQMNMARLFPDQSAKAMRIVVAQIAVAQPSALGAMMPVLGRDIRLYCGFLFTVHAELGAPRFKSVYGEGGQVHMVRTWMERLKEAPPRSLTLSDVIDHFRTVITNGGGD